MSIPQALSRYAGRFAALLLVTAVAVAVMVASGTRLGTQDPPAGNPAPPGEVQPLTAAPVSLAAANRETIEILDRYSGIIHPYERFTLAFELPGRIERLGTAVDGTTVDDGDEVTAGMELAVLDRRTLLARQNETAARLEKARDDLERAKTLREQGTAAIAAAEYQEAVTNVAVAEAQAAVASKNLEDAVLKSPVDGVVARRMVNAGESVTVLQTAFEIVQVRQVLLLLGVPEARINDIQRRQRAIEKNRELARQAKEQGRPSPLADEDLVFRAHVRLLGKDRFGSPAEQLQGEVYRIGQTADDKTGLFEVEVLLPNPERHLRPGQIAVADLVIDRIEGYRLPLSSVVYRDEKPNLFLVEQTQVDVQFLFHDLGQWPQYVARMYALENFTEQGDDVILKELPSDLPYAVVRGQHRLVDGRRVRVVSCDMGGDE
jgi:RND family efflux transporter MFP subunit